MNPPNKHGHDGGGRGAKRQGHAHVPASPTASQGAQMLKEAPTVPINEGKEISPLTAPTACASLIYLVYDIIKGIFMPFIRVIEYLVECRCLLTTREEGGCCCCVSIVTRCCYRMWNNSNLFWILSWVGLLIGWWIWIYGLVWSGYYLIETTSISPINVTQPLQQAPYVVRQHFPMKAFHAIPGIFITFAYAIRLCDCASWHRQDNPFPEDENRRPCDLGKLRLFTTVLCAGSGMMICLLWVMLILSFGDFSTSVNKDGVKTLHVEDSAYMVPAGAILLQCTLLIAAMLCSYKAERNANIKKQHDEGFYDDDSYAC